MSKTCAINVLGETFHDVDTPAQQFGRFEPFVTLWQSKRRQTRIPAWRDFGFEDFRGWHGWICVFDVIDREEFDLFVRLWGTNVVRLLGFEMTGRSLRRTKRQSAGTFEGYEPDDMDFWQAVQRDRVIGLTDGRLIAGPGRFVRYQDIFLPLSSDGVVVDKLISATAAPEF